MRSIAERKPFVNEQEMFFMPDVRIIEKAYRCPFSWKATPWDEIWDAYIKAKDQIAACPKIVENAFIS